MNVQQNGLMHGRRVEIFHHESDPAWGYKQPQEDTFAVYYPKDYDSTKTYPLCVVFHSAGHGVWSCFGCVERDGNHDIYHVPDDMFGLYLDCYTQRYTEGNTDWWWGGNDANEDGITERSGTAQQPVEKRAIATVEWTIGNYPIDKERVYAVGNSMGGSGSLGIALCRGDLFAALKVNVPAGTRHAMDRCALDREAPAGFKIPDPPVLVDYSAQDDCWSRGHDRFYKAMQAHRYAAMGFWGAFGHANDNSIIEKENDLVHAFNIFSVRLHEAYPAFTNASTDDAMPWPDHLDSKAAGQINGFFRWRVLCDTAEEFSIELRLLGESEWQSRMTFPTESTADVTLRRLQNFTAAPGEKIAYTFGDQSGTVTADDALTVPHLTIRREPTVLTLRK